MNPIRKATPDSEAVASSEDERPWPATSAFGTLPRKENSVTGFGAGIWAQKRGSIKMDKAARNNAANAAREGRLASAHSFSSALRPGSTPSPAASEGSGALPFPIPLHPTPKAGRSLSHSHGQREFMTSRPTASDHASVLPLDLLSEEVDTETDSEMGGPLGQTASQPPVKSFQRTTTFPNMFDPVRSPTEAEESANGVTSRFKPLKSDRGADGTFNHTSVEQRQRRLWESSLGWEDLPSVNESRRHSLADIPTRRGSLSAAGSSNLGGSGYWGAASEAFEHATERQGEFGEHSLYGSNSAVPRVNSIDAGSIKFGEQDDQAKANDVPAMYKVPFIEIADHERSEVDRRAAANATSGSPFGQPGRPRKQLFIVSFKCSRVDVFYLLDNTGLFIKEGDIVIVEADRGQDLGTVQHANVSNDEARLYKRKYGEEQYKWLMMFSRNSTQGNINPNAQVYGENQASRNNMLNNAPMAMQGVPRDSFNNLKPKAIKRLASTHEIRMLGEKEGNEAKAKRTCQQKVNHLHLDMEILDAEWQWDFQKLIFYYYADHYINFKDLITELYRIYKTRIWLSAINPASFSQHAHGQPPSGIGPGAITSFNPQGPNNAYTMAYGSDPDPYGAIPPYSIGYETYTPNYPAIPGVANSFAPPMFPPVGHQATPSLPPGVAPTGSLEDYNFYYDRSVGVDEAPGARPPQHQPNSPVNFNSPEEYLVAYRANSSAQAPGAPLGFGGMPPPVGPMGSHGAIGNRGPPSNNPNNQGMGGGPDGGFAYAPAGPRRSFLQRAGGMDPSVSRPIGLFGGADSTMRNAQSRSSGDRIAPDQTVHTYLQGLSLHGGDQTRVPMQTRQQ